MAFLDAHNGMDALMHDRFEDGDRIVGIAADDQLAECVGRRAAVVILAGDPGLLAPCDVKPKLGWIAAGSVLPMASKSGRSASKAARSQASAVSYSFLSFDIRAGP